jgi:ATP-binding cassette, subfamily B, bacterial
MRRLPTVLQMGSVDCAASCLASVLAYFGRRVGLAQLREECGVSRGGTRLREIARAAKLHGLAASAISVTLDGLGECSRPAILYWNFNHFVVLDRMRGKSAVVMDPAFGRRVVSSAELRRSFTGVALIFERTSTFTKIAGSSSNWKRYARYALDFPGALILVLATTILLHISGLLLAGANQLILDLIVANRQEHLFLPAVAGLLILSSVTPGLMLLRLQVITRLEDSLDAKILNDFVRHLLRLPAAFFAVRTPADLVRRVRMNVSARDFSATRICSLLLDCVMLVIYAGLLVSLSVPVGLIIVTIGLLRLALILFTSTSLGSAAAEEQLASAREAAPVYEALGACETVKAQRLEPWVSRKAGILTDERLATGNARQRLATWATHVPGVMDGVGLAATLVMAGVEVMEHRMSIGVLGALLTLRLAFLWPLDHVGSALIHVQVYLRKLDRLEDVLATPTETSGDQRLLRFAGGLSYRKVGVRHDPEGPWIFRDLDLRISPGESLAIVGPSGAGKSTLARLAVGLLSPTEGDVYLDEHDLRSLEISTARALISLVPQEVHLFDATLRWNVTVGRPDITDEQVTDALRMADLGPLLDGLPWGLDSLLGPNGASLSGGQRQRCAIARAIVSKPRVLVLDEATSSLDRDTEQRVLEGVGSLGVTLVLITHRLSTASRFGRVVVLDRGRIVADGAYPDVSLAPGTGGGSPASSSAPSAS